MSTVDYSDEEAAGALARVLASSTWEAVGLAHGYLAQLQGASTESAAREAFRHGQLTLTHARQLLSRAQKEGFLAVLRLRDRLGSAENPITKLFPAAITEQRFIALAEDLMHLRAGLDYSDDRESGHSLQDVTLVEGELRLPVNIKNAGTRFERAAELVGVDPDDCIPIPAYKAYAAIERAPDLLYVVAVDYGLVKKLEQVLPATLSRDELIAWDLLNRYAGARLRSAEDAFVFGTARRYWPALSQAAQDVPFHAISARKAIRILQTKPRRTPGIGLRAWGTGASAEVNVHLSLSEDTTPWEGVSSRITANGLQDIIRAVNRKRWEFVYDPEI